MVDNIIYEFDGDVGDILFVYEDRIVIRHKGITNFFLGMAESKTIFYSDMISAQVKKSGLTAAYLKFSVPNEQSYEHARYGEAQNEKTVTFVDNMSDKAFEIERYINKRIKETKKNEKVVYPQNTDDMLKSFKELLDAGLISKEEFETRKKQLLEL